MKKIVCISAAAIMILGFAACKKDGIFNPKQKISEIYHSSECMDTSPDGESVLKKTEKLLDQVWTWENDLLKSIEHKNYDHLYENGNDFFMPLASHFLYMEYNGKQLSQVKVVQGVGTAQESMILKYIYNKSKLTTVEEWVDGEIVATINYEHKGAKISKITVASSYLDNIWGNINIDKKSTSSAIMQLLLPEIVNKQLNDVIVENNTLKESKNSQLTEFCCFELQWSGHNIKETTLSFTAFPSKKFLTSYQYDKKKNPFYNSLFSFSEDGSPIIYSENNVIKSNSRITTLSRPTIDDSMIEYEYKYNDGNFPTEEMSIKNENTSHKTIIYYNYK